MSKLSTGLVSIGNFINYLLYLLDPFPRGLEVDLEGSSTFPTLTLSMHINRLGLISHFYGCLLNGITIHYGSWVGATALCIEVGWRCTIAVLAWYSTHWLLGCECAVKSCCAPFGHLNAAYMGIDGHIQLYIWVFKCI